MWVLQNLSIFFDINNHLEDDQDYLFPDHRPGTTASELDRALDKDGETEKGGKGQEDEEDEVSEPKIRTQCNSATRSSLQFQDCSFSTISLVDWALKV
jgi:hypothetical protein